jgi:hypothetical protein
MNRNGIAMLKQHKNLILKLVLSAGVILLLGFSGGQAASTFVESLPIIPHQVFGWVKINDGFVPEGTVVSAWCDGIKAAEGLAVEYGDESWFSLDVPADDPVTPEKDGCEVGDEISFTVADFVADQTESWAAEQISRLDLTASSTPPAHHSVSGVVMVNGNYIPEGITISAWCSGSKYVEVSAEIIGGQSVYTLHVPGDDWLTTDLEGCSTGETIHFKIGLLDANESLMWASGLNSTQDLTSTSESPEHKVYGMVRINGEFVPEGTLVSAWCGGAKMVENGTSISQENKAWYLLHIPGDDPYTSQNEGCESGETVQFSIGDLVADQTTIWQAGTEPIQLDLSAGAPMNQIFIPLIVK